MKIVHTSDWHLGRRFKGISRDEEHRAVLDHLAAYIEAERVDLVLHTGDVFDVRSPPPEAERLANEFFVRVRRAGARSIVIAGNHDDPRRFDARAELSSYAGITLLGRPRLGEDGGALTLTLGSGEVAVVAALPFVTPGSWVGAEDLVENEASGYGKYARLFQAAARELGTHFRADAVNLFMAHTFLHGAVFGESERRVHVGSEWAALAEALPPASYVALGHIHKPQQAPGLGTAHYAGSSLQLDFGEVGQEKSFVVVRAEPGAPAHIERVPYQGGLPLMDFRGTLTELADRASELGQGCWLRVTLTLREPEVDLTQKVRALVKNALVVRAELPRRVEVAAPRPAKGATPREYYAAYHLRAQGQVPSPELLATFDELHQAAEAGRDDV
ncbi:MAG: exonuclease SbcCD subunit D [Polyangiaceae bacterium]|nr:exonuclease SbcCD subunit D [Polyangiaceae bacterium]